MGSSIKYALIDDKNDTSGKHHPAKVASVVDHYLGLYGHSSSMDLFNMPINGLSTEAALSTALKSSTSEVFNNSWANPGVTHASGAMLFFSPAAYHIYQDAFLSGQTLVFAAGNMGKVAPLTVSAEASLPYALNVSAMENDQIAWYSCANPEMTNYVTYGTAEYYAPDPTSIGTSFAAPRVTALVSLLQDKYGGKLTQSEIHTILDMNSVGKSMTAAGHPEIGSYVYHVIDDAAFDRALNDSYTPGQCTTRMQVDALYNLHLDRVADTPGLDYWTGVAQTKGIAYVSQQMKASPEYKTAAENPIDQVTLFEKVQAMYHLFLNREADDPGISWWLDKIMTEQTPTLDEILTTGQHIELSGIQQQFLAGAGMQLPSWF